MLSNFRIGTRLGIGFGIVLIAALASCIAIAYIGFESQQRVLSATQIMNDRTNAIKSLTVQQLTSAVSARNRLLQVAMLSTPGEVVKAELIKYQSTNKEMELEESDLSKSGLDAKSQSLLDGATEIRKKIEPIVEKALDVVEHLDGEGSVEVMAKLASIQATLTEQLNQLLLNEQRISEENLVEIKHANIVKIASMGAALLLVIGSSVVFAILLTRSVTRPLKNAAIAADRVAQGDLSVEIDVSGRDESAALLRSLHTMAHQLSDMVLAVRVATDSISIAAQEISRGNLDLSNRTEHQAGSLQRTSASLSELTNAVALNTEHADSARQLAELTASSASDGGATMSLVINTMSGISESSKRIADIIGVIDGIAFQTNILALNAAVEAARAGEQGRGFAVVASEVRALAQRVTTAASEVRTLITESVDRVDEGSRQVSHMNVTMNQLVKCSQQVKGLIDEIAHASNVQGQNIDSVDIALREVDVATQQNTALVEEVAAVAQSLVGQTQALGELIGRFNISDAKKRYSLVAPQRMVLAESLSSNRRGEMSHV